MYKNYFYFTELPFSIAPDPHFMYMSARHQEGFAHLLYGINVGGGFVALTGEVGTGKTTLCHCLLQELPKNIDIALILNPKLNAEELLEAICDELTIPYDKNHPSLKKLVDALNQHLLDAHAQGRRTVLLIDEAQNLSMEVLEQVRLLTNLETSKTKLLQIILVGQPELNQLLMRKDLRQLNQRITARYHLLPLSLEDTNAYIRHRLYVCNGNPNLFKPEAIKKIYQLSSGIPRVINILCDRALLGAYASSAQVITPKIVNIAAKETLSTNENKNRRIPFLLSLLVLSSIAFGFYHAESLRGLIIAKKEIAPLLTVPDPVVKSTPEIVSQPATLKPQVNNALTPPFIPTPSPTIEPIKFDSWLANPELSLNSGLINALQIMGQTPPANGLIDCDALATQGLNCLFGKTSWKNLLKMNRPAILELDLTSEAKRHVLLTGFRQGQPVLRFNDNITFPLAELLNYWNGNYLILWKAQASGIKTVFPGQTSDHVLWLRQQLTAFDGIDELTENPRFFDNALKKRVINFQHHNNLSEDGKIGAQTMIYLDNPPGSENTPRLNISD